MKLNEVMSLKSLMPDLQKNSVYMKWTKKMYKIDPYCEFEQASKNEPELIYCRAADGGGTVIGIFDQRAKKEIPVKLPHWMPRKYDA